MLGLNGATLTNLYVKNYLDWLGETNPTPTLLRANVGLFGTQGHYTNQSALAGRIQSGEGKFIYYATFSVRF